MLLWNARCTSSELFSPETREAKQLKFVLLLLANTSRLAEIHCARCVTSRRVTSARRKSCKVVIAACVPRIKKKKAFPAAPLFYTHTNTRVGWFSGGHSPKRARAQVIWHKRFFILSRLCVRPRNCFFDSQLCAVLNNSQRGHAAFVYRRFHFALGFMTLFFGASNCNNSVQLAAVDDLFAAPFILRAFGNNFKWLLCKVKKTSF